jgi:hypothetical protein
MVDTHSYSKAKNDHDQLKAKLRDQYDVNFKEWKSSELFKGKKDWANLSDSDKDRVIIEVIRWMDLSKIKFFVSAIDTNKFFNL